MPAETPPPPRPLGWAPRAARLRLSCLGLPSCFYPEDYSHWGLGDPRPCPQPFRCPGPPVGPALPGPASQRGCNTAGQALVRPGPSGGNRRLLNRVGREAGPHQASRPRSKCHLLSRSLEKHSSGRAREGPAEAGCGGQARRALGRPGAGPRPPEQTALVTHGNWSRAWAPLPSPFGSSGHPPLSAAGDAAVRLCVEPGASPGWGPCACLCLSSVIGVEFTWHPVCAFQVQHSGSSAYSQTRTAITPVKFRTSSSPPGETPHQVGVPHPPRGPPP